MSVQTLTEQSQQATAKEKGRCYRNFQAYSGILEQYASDGAFLWLLRSQVITGSAYRAKDMAELERRIQACLQGLELAGEVGWGVCEEQLQYEGPGEVFVALVIALQRHDLASIKRVCEVAIKAEDASKGLVGALAWVDGKTAGYWVERFLGVKDPVYRYLGLAVCSARRECNPERLWALLQEPGLTKTPELHSRALRLIGEIKRYEMVPALNAAMDADDPVVRFWAHWSAALLGNMAAANNLKSWLTAEGPLSDTALQLVFTVLPLEVARSWITELARNEESLRTAVKAIGILGDPEAVPWLIQQMADPQQARIAGWSYSLITGANLEELGLVAGAAPGYKAGPTDIAEEEEVAMESDDDLPWPAPERVNEHWLSHADQFAGKRNYMLGQERGTLLPQATMDEITQSQRALMILQQAASQREAPYANIKARQREY